MGTWHQQDLTTEAGAPPTPAVKPAAYVFKAQGTQHVVYTDDNDGHVHELWWDTSGWHHNDLTVATGAPDFAAPPAAYVFDLQGTQHVVYAGFIAGQSPTLPLQELWWDSTGWHRNDLSATSGAPYARSRPAAYVFDAQGTQHVVYFGTNDAHVHEMWWDLDGWHHNDLTAATGSPEPAGDAGAVGYVFDAHQTQHVFYVGSADEHVHELWWDDSGWHHYDLTAATGAPNPYFLGVSAYTFDAQGTQHVVYSGVDKHVHELWWDHDGWHHSDSAPSPARPRQRSPLRPGTSSMPNAPSMSSTSERTAMCTSCGGTPAAGTTTTSVQSLVPQPRTPPMTAGRPATPSRRSARSTSSTSAQTPTFTNCGGADALRLWRGNSSWPLANHTPE